MARKARTTKELPPPLPPELRTVGQLVAESIRLYGQNFLRALPLGIVVGVINQLTADIDRAGVALSLVVVAPVFAAAYAYAAKLATDASTTRRSWFVAVGVGSLVFVPAALFFPWFALAGVLWLALIGLAVPAAMVEGASFTGSLQRGLALGRVDYIHAAASLATLVILFFLMRLGLALLLESQADNTVRTAIFLSDTVLAPLLFLGGALLYVDQEARLRSRGDPHEIEDLFRNQRDERE
ncbi:MAG: hypothetical protein OEW52_03825 [Thermoleophilia bacterium]|nr:hypothetical protein [Thermoleophilia bacterium]MDH4340596.1 hypothetical protein [Thermoleophilia bacterium]MDH5280264.1 hypothetical protein [Thermoleophilia bacterium]